MIILDVREKDEFLEGHVAEAINLPLSSLMSSNVVHIDSLDRNDEIIVYCRTGNRAARAIEILDKQGFTKLINGIDQYTTQKHIDSLKSS